MRKWILALLLACPIIGLGQSTSFYTDRAVGTFPVGNNGVQTLVPLAYVQVRVCTSADINTTGSPCPHLASVTDLSGNPLTVSGGNFGQIKTDVTGRFNFGCSPGALWVQVAPAGTNTPQLNYAITCAFPAGSTIPGGTFSGTVTISNGNLALNNQALIQFVNTSGLGIINFAQVDRGVGTTDSIVLSGIELGSATNPLLGETGTGNNAVTDVSPAITTPNIVTGFQIGGTAPSGRYPKGNGTNYVQSTGAASGVGTPTACTNQFVTSFTLNGDAAPTSVCSSVTQTNLGSETQTQPFRGTWSAFTQATTILSALNRWTVDKAITITGIEYQAITAGATCSTAPVITVKDNGSATAATITLANTVAGASTTGLAVNVTAGHLLDTEVTTTSAGCGINWVNVAVTIQYKMQ